MPFFVGPADFDGNAATLDLPTPPHGSSLVFLVPDIGVAAYRQHEDLGARAVRVRVAVESAPPGVPASAAHALPAPPIRVPFEPSLNVAVSPAAAFAPTKSFKVYANDIHDYLDVIGRLAYVGTRYAFYDDTTNQKSFSSEDYARMDARAAEDYGQLVNLFGAPPDLDGNGRVIALVSRTASTRRPANGGVNGCNLQPGATECGGLGEIVYLWSLDGFPDADRRHEFYARDYFPRILLHETIHLCQLRTALERHIRIDGVAVPAYLGEGQAMLMRFLRPDGGVDWVELWELVARHRLHDNPFDYPYALGGLFVWWMDQHYGSSVQRALMDAEVDSNAMDPVAKATGAPEPLVLAEFYAALRLDDTAYGRDIGLDFGRAHVHEFISKVPVTPIRDGESKEAQVFATGYSAFEVAHTTPVRFRVGTAGAKAFVLVVQP